MRYTSSDRRDEQLVRRAVSRRHVLELGLAATAGVILAACGDSSATITKAAATKPAGSDLGAVEHVIFLMKENRSFDHYFGTYPGARGFDDHPAGDLGAFAQPYAAAPGGALLPFHLDTSAAGTTCTNDLTHNWLPQHLCRDGGTMKKFVETHTSSVYEGPEYGTVTMGYYRRADLPYFYALADAFTLCDNYHCSVLGPTHPNRLMAIAGTLDPAGTHGGPIVTTNSLPSYKFTLDMDTMPEVLEDAGVGWKVYNPPGALYQPESPLVIAVSDSVLPYFSQYQRPTTAIHQKAFAPIYPDDFVSDVRNGTLPQVSWIIPPVGYDEHPPAPPSLGEWFTNSVLQTLVSNPEVWSKTVLFVMYDENDGFFDHVPPPVAPPGTPGEYLTASPLPSTAQGLDGPIGLGMRVPMLVVSPFSRGGHIYSEVADHTSQLRFLEERFGVTAPGISAWRRKTVADLTGALRTTSPDPSVPDLPSTSGDTAAAASAQGCTALDLAEIGGDDPAIPIPDPQQMPTQEA